MSAHDHYWIIRLGPLVIRDDIWSQPGRPIANFYWRGTWILTLQRHSMSLNTREKLHIWYFSLLKVCGKRLWHQVQKNDIPFGGSTGRT